jgi:DNA-binding MarR family transcriptional regulator
VRSTTAPVDVAQSLRLSITRLARLLRQQDQSGLGPTLTSALSTVRRHGGLTHGELAAHERLAPPTITAIVAKLEALGLVERTNDSVDRRITRIAITPAGIARLDDVRHRRTEWLDAQLRALTPKELATITAALEPLARLCDPAVTSR